MFMYMKVSHITLTLCSIPHLLIQRVFGNLTRKEFLGGNWSSAYVKVGHSDTNKIYNWLVTHNIQPHQLTVDAPLGLAPGGG